jgi:hypothetical protein
MDLIELRQALRRWRVHAIAAVLVVGALALLALGPAENRFESSTTLLVTPRAERFETASPGILRIVLPNVLVVARSRGLHDEVAPELGKLGDADVETDGTFVPDSGVLVLTARSSSADAAVAWSAALADGVVERYRDDDYLVVSVLDPAQDAHRPGPFDRAVDLAGIGLLALFAAILTVFTMQRVHESSDLAGRLRNDGLRVLGELVVYGRSSRPVFKHDQQASRLAMSLSSAPGVADRDRFVIISTGTRPSVAVVDAIRAGLQQVGLQRMHKVVLGPELDDLATLRQETYGGGRCIVVLDSNQRVDQLVRDVEELVAADVPVIGVVVIRRRMLLRRSPSDDRRKQSKARPTAKGRRR